MNNVTVHFTGIFRVPFGFQFQPLPQDDLYLSLLGEDNPTIASLAFGAVVDDKFVLAMFVLPGDFENDELPLLYELIHAYMADLDGDEPPMPGNFTSFSAPGDPYLN